MWAIRLIDSNIVECDSVAIWIKLEKKQFEIF